MIMADSEDHSEDASSVVVSGFKSEAVFTPTKWESSPLSLSSNSK